MSRQIAVRIPEAELAELDAAVSRGVFPSRYAAVQEAVRRLVREERDRVIADEYRRAYAERPDAPAERGAEAWAAVIQEAETSR